MARRKVVKTVDMTNAHGGRRYGAGRPVLPFGSRVVKISLSLTPEHYCWLQDQAGSATGVVRHLIDVAIEQGYRVVVDEARR